MFPALTQLSALQAVESQVRRMEMKIFALLYN